MINVCRPQPTHASVLRSEVIRIEILLENVSLLRQQIKYSARLKHVSSHSNFVVPEITKTMEKSTLSYVTDGICTRLEISLIQALPELSAPCHHERCLRRTETWLCHNLHLTAQHMASAQLNEHTFRTAEVKCLPCVENEAQDPEETDLHS